MRERIMQDISIEQGDTGWLFILATLAMAN